MQKSYRSGFTLIELMIVVAIIAVLAAVAIPNMLRARVEANQASAIGDLRVIGAAQITYNTTKYTYADFEDLTTSDSGPGSALLDSGWAEGRVKSGYSFSMPTVTPNSFECFADPTEPGMTGVQFFRVDSSGIVRYELGARPDGASPTVGNPHS